MTKFLTLLILECAFFLCVMGIGVWVAFNYSIYLALAPFVLAGGLITWNIVRECSYADKGFKEIDDE